MAKMTMHKELDMLRKEVEELRKQKIKTQKEEETAHLEVKEKEDKEIAEVKDKAEEIMNSLEEGKTDAKEALNQLVGSFKKDYENLSPTSAIVLFALGVAFGNAISSK